MDNSKAERYGFLLGSKAGIRPTTIVDVFKRKIIEFLIGVHKANKYKSVDWEKLDLSQKEFYWITQLRTELLTIEYLLLLQERVVNTGFDKGEFKEEKINHADEVRIISDFKHSLMKKIKTIQLSEAALVILGGDEGIKKIASGFFTIEDLLIVLAVSDEKVSESSLRALKITSSK